MGYESRRLWVRIYMNIKSLMYVSSSNKLLFRLNLKESWLKYMRPTLRKLRVKNLYHSWKVNKNSMGEKIW